jgi:uncharacterized membrane protein
MIKETHLRTTVKAGVYRVTTTTLAICLTILYGATLSQALTFGAAAFFIGFFTFYLYDRIWLFFGWNRNDRGSDTKLRSIAKAFGYRTCILLMTVALSRATFTDSNITAFLMAGTQFLTNMLVYFLLERIWNRIAWGKIIPITEGEHGDNI